MPVSASIWKGMANSVAKLKGSGYQHVLVIASPLDIRVSVIPRHYPGRFFGPFGLLHIHPDGITENRCIAIKFARITVEHEVSLFKPAMG